MEIEPQARIPDSSEPLEFAEPPTPLSLNYGQPPSPLDLNLDLQVREPPDFELARPSAVGILDGERAAEPERHFQVSRISRSLSDRELRYPRIQAGLTFVGFGALGLVCLLLYTRALHPEFDWVALVSEYWYPYAGLASLGVAGLIVLGRESLRS
ncbi:MAG TPA: hypothetical protein IGS31_11930 [Oscillatoriales cyanobacterium M4454_W2019_049]|nr:hypothetical protein [Oscillatoriales cyanobacterium M4454_W2019_049]